MTRVYVNAGPAEFANLTALLWSASVEFLPDATEADVIIAAPDAETGELQIRENSPPVLIISNQPRREWQNVMPENVTSAELLAAIQAVQAGLIVSHPDLIQETQERPAIEPVLTPREVEVLSRIAEGLPNKIIAHELGISDHTVKFHVAQILSKLQAGSRTEAVTAGLRLGIVHL